MIGGPPLWTAPYQGIRFVERGSSFDGCHCYGLVRLVYARERNIILPAHAGIKATDTLTAARAMRAAARSSDWSEVKPLDYQDFDVVLMASYHRTKGNLRRYRGHVGLIVGRRFVLHIEKEIDALCVPLNDQTVCHRIVSVHRYVQ